MYVMKQDFIFSLLFGYGMNESGKGGHRCGFFSFPFYTSNFDVECNIVGSVHNYENGIACVLVSYFFLFLYVGAVGF